MSQDFEKISRVLAKSLDIKVDELNHSFARADSTDIAAICHLHRLGFGRADALLPKILAWRFFDFAKNGSDMFVLRYQGNIIAAVGAEPVQIKIGDAVIQGVRTGDIVVHPQYMKNGIGAWMNLYMRHHFPIVMAMGANENSSSMVRRMFTPINCRHHLKILFSTEQYFKTKGWSDFYVQWFSSMATVPLMLSRWFFNTSLDHGYQIKIAENSDNLATFFNHPAYRPRLLHTALRSSDYCQWRYDRNPKSQFNVVEFYRDAELVGYAVIKKRQAAKNHNWQLMDWDLLPELRDKRYFKLLFSAVVEWTAAQGAESLSVLASDSLSVESLIQTGFSHRATEDGFYIWAKPEIDPEIFNPNSWFLTFADTDEAL